MVIQYLTPEQEQQVQTLNDFNNSAYGGVWNPALEDGAKQATNSLYEAAFEPLTADGKPTASIDRETLALLEPHHDAMRAAILDNLTQGKIAASDFYEVLYNVLADSGEVTSNILPMSPDTVATLMDQLATAEAYASGGCDVCAACGACGACAACGACGSCVLSVVIGTGVVLTTGGAVGVGGAVAYVF